MSDFLKKHKKIFQSLLSVLILLTLWQVTALLIDRNIIFPTPKSTLFALIDLLGEATLYNALLSSFLASLICFLASYLVAMLLAVIALYFGFLSQLFKIFTAFCRALPVLAITLVAVTFFSARGATILIGALAIFPLCFTNILGALKNVDSELIDYTRLEASNRREIVFFGYLPQIRPYLVSTAAAAFGMCIKVVISAEVLAMPLKSIGFNLKLYYSQLDIQYVFAYVLAAIIMGTLVEWLISLLNYR